MKQMMHNISLNEGHFHEMCQRLNVTKFPFDPMHNFDEELTCVMTGGVKYGEQTQVYS
jgi:hypothetical protein